MDWAGYDVLRALLAIGGASYMLSTVAANDQPADSKLAPDAKPPTRLLIVEDDYLVALDVERIVLKAGYVVVGIAATAEDALKQAEQARPDLVLMDIRLATARDGIDAAIELRQKFNINCLIVSSHIDKATVQRAAAAAPGGFVSKPVSEAALTRAIAAALSGP